MTQKSAEKKPAARQARGPARGRTANGAAAAPAPERFRFWPELDVAPGVAQLLADAAAELPKASAGELQGAVSCDLVGDAEHWSLRAVARRTGQQRELVRLVEDGGRYLLLSRGPVVNCAGLAAAERALAAELKGERTRALLAELRRR